MEEVISDEERNSRAAFVDGMPTPSPPSLAGRAKRVRSWSLGGGRPNKAGRRTECRASSSGPSRGPIPGTVRLRYVHLLVSPCVSAAKAA